MLSAKRALSAARFMDAEILRLLNILHSLGSKDDQGRAAVTFGVLFRETESIFESLAAVLKVAKRRQYIAYNSEMLLHGVHDQVVVTALSQTVEMADASTCRLQC